MLRRCNEHTCVQAWFTVLCYLRASWLNHHCQPNSVVVFEGLTLHVHTVQEVPASGSSEVHCEGEGGRWEVVFLPLTLLLPIQLFISYVDLLDPRSKRQEALLNGWYFTCNCPRCTEVSGQAGLCGRQVLLLAYLDESTALILFCCTTCLRSLSGWVASLWVVPLMYAAVSCQNVRYIKTFGT